MSRAPLIAQVAMPLALSRPLSYLVPPELQGRLVPGHRVRVPLRGRRAFGIVVALSCEPLPGVKLRAIEALDPDDVLLSPVLLELTQWVARYYAAPLGMVLEAAVPRAVARPPAKAGENDGAAPGHSGREGSASPFVLNPDQAQALAAIRVGLEAGRAATYLLQGVTGSGKTEVYIQAMATALERGRSALLLVPEIALGTQVVARIRERFGEAAVEYHSQLTPGERRRAWWSVHRGARIVVGARSAVFVPLARLGLIVVDEEHEPSYKQNETPRYHGRDTALMRARLEKAVTVLGSATPSLESRRNAELGKYEHLRLPERVEARMRARVTLVDLRAVGATGPQEGAPAAGATGVPVEPPAAGASPADPMAVRIVSAGDSDRGEPLSDYLRERLRAAIGAGDQAILFLNRRGYSTAVQCRHCGHVFECPRCSVVLTFHRTEHLLRCHYCNHELRRQETCPKCGGHDFSYSGVGTQRVEAALVQHLPGARVLRMDLDSTRRRGTLAGMIASFERGDADVLLGTQMVAKGFDFPRVTLVGVINADREMNLPDFRAQERAFQLLTQVAGRAGRGVKPGEVVFQTYLPDHHVVTTAGRQDYEDFYRFELEERRQFHYAPFRRMANLLFDGPDEAAVIRKANTVADQLRDRPGLMLLGPAPMPLSRLKNQYRWHLTLLSGRPAILMAALGMILESAWSARQRGGVRIQGDMDPVSML
ncbi:MAG: primosomal protein N' [Candidatus Eisenbacteria bacterium]